MSKRLQVLLDESEYRELRQVARRNHMTLSQWVRSALRAVRRREPGARAEAKLAAVRTAARHEFPSADIDRMLGEIERGYLSGGTP